ncbi:MAG: DUF2062 domain-containing protein [Bacteroidota bacterium]
MFKRRIPLPIHKRAGSVLWPRGGWRRSGTYVAHRLRRLPGTPYRIAAGFASGAAISCTPFIGLHFVLSAALAFLVRGNIIASAIGTAVGNPWTFPFIWLWTYSLGRWIMGGGHGFRLLPDDLSLMQLIFDHPMEVLLPMTVGSIPTAIVAWFVFFWPLQRVIAVYQGTRRRRLRERLHRQFEMAEQATAADESHSPPPELHRKTEGQR